ncbi:Regulatory protein SoxS [compost metagenome]
MIEEMSHSSEVSLGSIREFMENKFLPRFVETNKLMTTINPYSAKETSFFLNNHYKDDSYLVYEMNSHLKITTIANPGTQNITFYYLKDNIIIDANYFYETTDRSPDREFIAGIAQAPKQKWIARTVKSENGSDFADSRVLTYVYTLPFMAEGDSIKGYFYVDVNLDYLENVLHTMLAPQMEKAYVFDSNNRLLLSTSASRSDQLQSLEQFLGQPEPGFKVRSEQGIREVVSYLTIPYSQDEWTYVVVRPMQSFFLSATKFKSDIISGCIILIIFGVICSFFLSQRSYVPVKKILSYIRKQHAGHIVLQLRNEHAIIDNLLHSLDKRLHEQTRVGLVHNAIHGNFNVLTEGLLIPTDACCMVAVVRMTSGESEEFKRQYMQLPQPVVCELLCMNADEIIILYYLYQVEGRTPEQIIKSHMEGIQALFTEEIVFNCGYGRPVWSEEDIHLSYKNALQALKYTFIYGMNAIISYEQVEFRKGFEKKIAYDAYQNALRAADTELVSGFLDEFMHELGWDNLQIEVVEFEIMQLITRLSHTIIELNLHDAVISSTDLFSQFKKSTLADTLDWLRQVNFDILDYLKASKENPHYAIIHDLKAYIDTHLEEDISLDSLAERALLSPSYISSLFGEILHISFSNYLTNARVDKAAELLRTGSLSVTDITTVVGYRNIQYFCRKFKEKYGVTPMQYRKSWHMTSDRLLPCVDSND